MQTALGRGLQRVEQCLRSGTPVIFYRKLDSPGRPACKAESLEIEIGMVGSISDGKVGTSP